MSFKDLATDVSELLIKEFLNKAAEYEDGESGMSNCIELYCKDNGYSEELAEKLYNYWFKTEALSHGIPLAVVQGKKKLSEVQPLPFSVCKMQDVVIEGIDAKDYPDLVDCYLESGCWPNGNKLTDKELDHVNDKHNDWIHELAELEVAGG